MPLLSIIIPTYNCENCISACVDSVVNQDFTNFEIIIQDGKSTDRTIEIIEGYRARYPSVPILIESKKDNGIYDAMNTAVERANGEWLFFLGSDDTMYNKNILSRVFTDQDNLQQDVLYGSVNSNRFNGVYDGEFSQEKILNHNICHQAIFLKRSVFESIGQFNVKYKAHADWDHNLRWFLSDTLSTRYIDVIVAEYADGGFSSENLDHVFLEEKNLKYLEYGRKVLKIRTKLRILKGELSGAFRARDKKMFWRIIRKIPGVLP